MKLGKQLQWIWRMLGVGVVGLALTPNMSAQVQTETTTTVGQPTTEFQVDRGP